MFYMLIAAVRASNKQKNAEISDIESHSKQWIWHSKRRHQREAEKLRSLTDEQLFGFNESDGN